jgi:hypothetical protein
MSRHNYYDAKAATKKAIKEYADAFFNENPHLAPKKPSKSTKTAKTSQIVVNVDKNSHKDEDWRDSWAKSHRMEPIKPTESTTDPNAAFKNRKEKKFNVTEWIEQCRQISDNI